MLTWPFTEIWRRRKGRFLNEEKAMRTMNSMERETRGKALRLRLGLILSLAGLTLLHSPLARATLVARTDVRDQYQTATETGSWPIGGGYYSQMAQIVTAGQYGFLDRVTCYLENVNATAPVFVTIRKVIGGAPSDGSIGDGMIPVSALPAYGNPRWVSVKISGTTGLAMTPGTQYAIVLSSPGGIVRWHTSSDDPYSGGAMLVDQEGSGWFRWTLEDAMFEAYVIPDSVDQAQSEQPYYRGVGNSPVAQTFTVGQFGILNRISVYLGNNSATSGDIAVSLRTVTNGGLPTATEVASGTITADAIPQPGYWGWVTAGIGGRIVSPGERYAILLSTSASGIRWAVTGSDAYAGGSLVVKSGIGWTIDARDGAFRAYLIPPILDQQQPDMSYSNDVRPDCAETTTGCISVPFTAGWSGLLSQVDVGLSMWGTDSAPSTAVIRVDVMTKVGSLIGSAAMSAGRLLCCDPNWYEFFPGEGGAIDALVTAGSGYMIRVALDAGSIRWYRAPHVTPWWPMSFRTYVLPVEPTVSSPPSVPPGTGSCAGGICPAASGGFTPADLTEGRTSQFQFEVRANGSVKGVFAFNDPQPNGLTLHGCTTESAACRLTVTTFACTDEDAIVIAGEFALKEGTATNYRLRLRGTRDGLGSFSLSTGGGYSYSITQSGIVDVTCPPDAGVGAGQD